MPKLGPPTAPRRASLRQNPKPLRQIHGPDRWLVDALDPRVRMAHLFALSSNRDPSHPTRGVGIRGC